MRRTLCIVGFALICLLVAATPRAQDYPAKPINVVVPFAAGGANDIQARIISQKLAEALGQPVRVENRPGAGGNIGTEFVARSAPDGYTLLFVSRRSLSSTPSSTKSCPMMRSAILPRSRCAAKLHNWSW
jgi:tripartite-type tricarboxylate transporter receptor subunit TctC